MYHFLSGYTAKVAGTERGLGKEPQPKFSACFGEPFLPRHPQVYAKMLGEKHAAAQCDLLAGEHGLGGRSVRRRRANEASVHARDGERGDRRATRSRTGQAAPDLPAFWSRQLSRRARRNCSTRAACGRIPQAYDRAAIELSTRFRKNFEKFGAVEEDILEAAPLGR